MAKTIADKQTVCSFGPVQELYEAAKSGDPDRLAKAVQKIEQAAEESDNLDHIREIARDEYIDSSCDIDVDDANFTHHNEESGYWVGAWLWVSDEMVEERQHDDEDDLG